VLRSLWGKSSQRDAEGAQQSEHRKAASGVSNPRRFEDKHHHCQNNRGNRTLPKRVEQCPANGSCPSSSN